MQSNRTSSTRLKSPSSPPHEVPIKLSCGAFHSAVLCESRNLFLWGDNNNFAVREVTSQSEMAVEVNVIPNVLDVSCGATFTTFVTAAGLFKLGGGDKRVRNIYPSGVSESIVLPEKQGAFHGLFNTINTTMNLYEENTNKVTVP